MSLNIRYKVYLISLIACLVGKQSLVLAQDKIVFTDRKDTLLVQMIEMKKEEIKFKLWPTSVNSSIKVAYTNNIAAVYLANGMMVYFAEKENISAKDFSEQSKLAIKLDPLALPRAIISGSIEYAIMPGLSAELGLGLSGLLRYNSEFLNEKTLTGGFVRLGLKFIQHDVSHNNNNHKNHVLIGSYIKPELVFLEQQHKSFYRNTQSPYDMQIRGVAAFVNFGKQWRLSKMFVLDYFFGIGLGMKEVKVTYDNQSSYLAGLEPSLTQLNGFAIISQSLTNPALGFQTGLKIGILLGEPK